MNKMPYILWLGGIFNEKTMISCPAVSPAANHWQSGLIRALSNQGKRVVELGHLPEALWPRGNPYPRIPSFTDDSFHQKYVKYWNVPALRNRSLCSSYLNAFRRICQDSGAPECVISYNVYEHSNLVGHEAMTSLKVPWIPIVADASGNPDKYRELKESISSASGQVFLSWKPYLDSNAKHKLHLDGGVNGFRENADIYLSDRASKVIFYSGVLNKWGGVNLLLEAFRHIQRHDVRLWICGKGVNYELRRALASDTRITYYGCVSDEKLEKLSRQAWVMVNPRSNDLPDNYHNFPSKVLEYLSYGKPIVSTWTEGLSPEYRKVLLVIEKESPEDLAAKIEEVLEWKIDERANLARRIRDFVVTSRTWNRQAKRVLAFIRSCSSIS